jgi:signal peptidase I
MDDKPPYRKWVGILLGFLLNGSAHFLSGNRSTGLKWHFGLLACGFLAMVLMAIPGTVSYVAGLGLFLAFIVFWFVMLKQSYRPVRRLGWIGWLAFVVLAVAIGPAERILLRQFIRPFKVPTGAMQPTICGSRVYEEQPEHSRLIDWIIRGNKFVEVRAANSGILSESRMGTYMIGDKFCHLPPLARPCVQPGQSVSEGQILWAGVVKVGDHVFAEMFTYRLRKPNRGDIVVFRPDHIKNLNPDGIYVKRVAGLPGERVRIDPPFLVVNDQKVTEPLIFKMISDKAEGYAGFQCGPGPGTESDGEIPVKSSEEIILGKDEYFLLGDNTRNSYDSRFCGPVQRKNIIGLVTRIYWPFDRINALEGK